MKVDKLKQELEKLIAQGLGEVDVAFKHYGNLPPLEEKEITRVVIGAGRVVLE